MSLHLVKLCVGVGEISELADWQKRRRREKKRVYHVTRMMPRRAAELIDGGSLYWVIRGLILVRQRIIAIEPSRRRANSQAPTSMPAPQAPSRIP